MVSATLQGNNYEPLDQEYINNQVKAETHFAKMRGESGDVEGRARAKHDAALKKFSEAAPRPAEKPELTKDDITAHRTMHPTITSNLPASILEDDTDPSYHNLLRASYYLSRQSSRTTGSSEKQNEVIKNITSMVDSGEEYDVTGKDTGRNLSEEDLDFAVDWSTRVMEKAQANHSFLRKHTIDTMFAQVPAGLVASLHENTLFEVSKLATATLVGYAAGGWLSYAGASLGFMVGGVPGAALGSIGGKMLGSFAGNLATYVGASRQATEEYKKKKGIEIPGYFEELGHATLGVAELSLLGHGLGYMAKSSYNLASRNYLGVKAGAMSEATSSYIKKYTGGVKNGLDAVEKKIADYKKGSGVVPSKLKRAAAEGAIISTELEAAELERAMPQTKLDVVEAAQLSSEIKDGYVPGSAVDENSQFVTTRDVQKNGGFKVSTDKNGRSFFNPNNLFKNASSVRKEMINLHKKIIDNLPNDKARLRYALNLLVDQDLQAEAYYDNFTIGELSKGLDMSQKQFFNIRKALKSEDSHVKMYEYIVDGKPTGDPMLDRIAQNIKDYKAAVHKEHGRIGAPINEIKNHATQSHDAGKINAATIKKWSEKTLLLLDQKRTFEQHTPKARAMGAAAKNAQKMLSDSKKYLKKHLKAVGDKTKVTDKNVFNIKVEDANVAAEMTRMRESLGKAVDNIENPKTRSGKPMKGWDDLTKKQQEKLALKALNKIGDEIIKNDGLITGRGIGLGGGFSAQRLLHFANGKSHFEYMKEYGKSGTDLFTSTFDEARSKSRALTMYSILGDDPAASFAEIKAHVYSNLKKDGFFPKNVLLKMGIEGSEKYFFTPTTYNSWVTSPLAAYTSLAGDTITRAQLLNSYVFPIAEEPTRRLFAKLLTPNNYAHFEKMAREYIRGNNKKEMTMLGLMRDINLRSSAETRFMHSMHTPPGAIKFLDNAMEAISWSEPLTKNNRLKAELQFNSGIGENINLGTPWEDMGRVRDFLRRSGVQEKEWNYLTKNKERFLSEWVPDARDREFMDNAFLFNSTNTLNKPGISAYDADLTYKLMRARTNYRNHVVTEHRHTTRGMFTGASGKVPGIGTWFVENALQFKGYAFTQHVHNIQKGDFIYSGSFTKQMSRDMGQNLVSGVLVTLLRHVTRGEIPNLDDADSLIRLGMEISDNMSVFPLYMDAIEGVYKMAHGDVHGATEHVLGGKKGSVALTKSAEIMHDYGKAAWSAAHDDNADALYNMRKHMPLSNFGLPGLMLRSLVYDNLCSLLGDDMPGVYEREFEDATKRRYRPMPGFETGRWTRDDAYVRRRG